jgi:hypothetical protein
MFRAPPYNFAGIRVQPEAKKSAWPGSPQKAACSGYVFQANWRRQLRGASKAPPGFAESDPADGRQSP